MKLEMMLSLTLLLTLISWTSADNVHVYPMNFSYVTRLPTNIFPVHYNLQLKTYLPGYIWKEDERSETFEGVVEIQVDVREATDRIVLHSDSLSIDNHRITTVDPNVRVVGIETTEAFQFLIFHLSKTIEPQEGVIIHIEFNGKLRRDDKGFYVATSPQSEGLPDRVNAVTQFETTAARFMVPCFDEPEFKATWQVNLTHPGGSVALSNTVEEVVNVISPEWLSTKFERTPRMSSYLLAIFIGDVLSQETATERGTRIRVYAPPAYINDVGYALNVSRVALEGFENLFNISYPIEKLDLVVVRGFASRAMENWGLLIHSDAFLLGNHTLIARTVIHEVAHQWFGNLVTMKFWNNVWLNEGLAAFMERRGLEFLFPDVDSDFIHTYGYQTEGFTGDDAHALSDLAQEKNGGIDIPYINYSKGSSLIRMIEMLIGKESFDNAIRQYLSMNSYNNVDDHDLYAALQSFTSSDLFGPDGNPLDIDTFASSWTYQNGYPTVYVERVNTKKNTIRLTQHMDKRLQSGYEEKGFYGYRWNIPIWYQQAGREEIQFAWLGSRQHSIELEVELPVVINANSDGYYRVVYSNDLFSAIADNLTADSQSYSDSTKYRLLHDSFLFSNYDFGLIHGLSKLSQVFLNDENPVIASGALKLAEKAKQMLNEATAEFEKAQKRITNRTALIAKDCDPVDESIDECLTRISFSNVLEDLCSNEQKYPGQSKHNLLEYLRIEIDSSLRGQVIQMINCSDPKIFEEVLNDEQYHLTEEEKLTIGKLIQGEAPSTKRRQFVTLKRSYY